MTYTKLGFSQGQVLTADAMNHIETGIDEAHKATESKQEKLVSGSNLKTINGQSLLGSGDVAIPQNESVTVDSSLSSTSTNPVQNKVIHAKFAEYDGAKVSKSGSRGTLSGYSVPSVTSGAVSITGESNDDVVVTSAVDVSVTNGSASQSWTKTVTLQNESATVTLGDSWTWVGGEAPTISANSIVVLKWTGSFGLASLVSGE